jgi:hypothetical protein
MSVLTANAVAQKLTPAAPTPTAGQSPFGCRRAISGAKSSVVTAEQAGDAFSASNPNEVGSVPNCAPQWLHPPGRKSRR